MWSIARRFFRDRAEAEDAVQDIFVDLWTKASRYDPAIAEEPVFVAMIARRRLIDRLRRNRREPAAEALEAAGSIADAHDSRWAFSRLLGYYFLVSRVLIGRDLSHD